LFVSTVLFACSFDCVTCCVVCVCDSLLSHIPPCVR
jgi:hypothetical protein